MVMMGMRRVPTRIFLTGHAFIIWRFSYTKLQSSNRMEVTKEVLAKTEWPTSIIAIFVCFCLKFEDYDQRRSRPFLINDNHQSVIEPPITNFNVYVDEKMRKVVQCLIINVQWSISDHQYLSIGDWWWWLFNAGYCRSWESTERWCGWTANYFENLWSLIITVSTDRDDRWSSQSALTLRVISREQVFHFSNISTFVAQHWSWYSCEFVCLACPTYGTNVTNGKKADLAK